MEKRLWIYDIEVFKNFFSYFAIDKNGEERLFIIWKDRNDYLKLIEHLNSEVSRMVGFNCLHYDYPILHYMYGDLMFDESKLEDSDYLTNMIFLKSQQILKTDSKIPSLPYWDVKIPQLDLFKLHHFDNSARSTSLKALEFWMRYDNLLESTVGFYESVDTIEQVNEIVKYNKNDVLATHKFYTFSSNEIEMRTILTNAYGIDMYNFNNAKIGAEIFAKYISEDLNIDIKELKALRTYRSIIHLKDCILPYVKFKTKGFQELLKFFNRQDIHENQIKGVFIDIKFNELGKLKDHCNINLKKNVAEKLNVVFDNIEYVFGTGGIHGCIKPGIYEIDDDYQIYDIDVASYYPNLGIQNNFYPAHLSQAFCKIYEKVYKTRIEAKKKAKADKTDKFNSILQEGLKLALNGVYGKSNDHYSFFYDTKYTLQITLNGQLLLAMLAEAILINTEKCNLLQINTDGMTFRVHKSEISIINEWCKKWEKLTKLELEFNNYSKMIIRDVNNYIAVGIERDSKPGESEKYFTLTDREQSIYRFNETGTRVIDIKYKGDFEIDKEYHKDTSFMIVPKAVAAYFIDNIDPYSFIRESRNIYDFCGREKSNSDSEVSIIEYDDSNFAIKKVKQQKVTRYYVTNKDGNLMIKSFKESGRSERVQKGFKVKVLNQIIDKPFKEYNIDYSYYDREVNKLIRSIHNPKVKSINKNTQLKLF